MYNLVDPLPLKRSLQENGIIISERVVLPSEWKIRDYNFITNGEIHWINQAASSVGEIEDTPVLFVNAPAMKTVTEAARFPPRHSMRSGTVLGAKDIEKIFQDAANQDLLSKCPEYGASLKPIAANISRAITHSGFQAGLPIVQAGNSVQAGVINRTTFEEIDHSRQMSVTGSLSNFLSPEFMQHPISQKATMALQKHGYHLDPKSPFASDDRQIIAAEISVRLMRPDLFSELEITRDEAVELAVGHNALLTYCHGQKAGRIIDQVRNVFGL